MFEASHPFAFFDYFRTPYEVRPRVQGNSHAGAAAFVRTLTAVEHRGRAARSLMWIGAETGSMNGEGTGLAASEASGRWLAMLD